ncbi:hypothetical protein BV140_1122 [Haemophilus influenzae]|nr:hypothetical protein BV083_1064 [Haemophilus influenzae]AVI97876.1 hypothetical protein BV085_1062 [Haemophilus influenzae]AVJ06895.1 hypothetical protein BV139_1121 [Haemophilus influenzae]AVJ08728.1 hypothetical protein BV140_1122 [Haemophilus influenzae]AVJ10456.1 hypothetical protein BVZ63_1015 [Haemophilus influenzae]
MKIYCKKQLKKPPHFLFLSLLIFAILRYSMAHFLLSKCCKSAVKI